MNAEASLAVAANRTTPPGGEKLIALYDGSCRFCTQQAKRLARFAGDAKVETRSFQDDGVLAAFPGVPYEACMKRMHVVAPDGRVYAGMESVVRVLLTLPVIGLLAYLYYIPGVRQLSELGYRIVARNRYRLAGKTACEPGGTCHLHS
jgi:predicted DCC family thiol-disulfide oxidoreductase YuxK